jgi:D-alanyl-D-alanine carboxypeptidase/D-alanyl-D-alanine-endopeptidase (penicillin-binding protein 4)
MNHVLRSVVRSPGNNATRTQFRHATLALLLLGGTARAAGGWPQVPTPTSSLTELRRQLDAATAPVRRRAFVGGMVRSLTSGEVLWALNAGVCCTPASNQKLLTTAAALDRLGPEYRFRTEVRLLGRLGPAGTLAGDLILRGGGDPTLATRDLDALAAAVREAGVRRVRGRLRADDTRFDRTRLGEGWAWDDESYAYAAQVSALTLDGNVATVRVLPGSRAGMPARVTVEPVPGYLRVRSVCVTAPAGSAPDVSVIRLRARNEVRVEGGIPLGSAPVLESVTVEEPALHAAAVWRELLARHGVRVEGETVLLGTPGPARLAAEHDSAPLAELLAQMNKPSNNLIAETLLKELGTTVAMPGTSAAGLTVVRQTAAGLGLDLAALRPFDGSGLSRMDLVSAENLCRLLAAMAAQADRAAFIASLPVAAVDGTLRSRMAGTPAAGNLRAKTGTLSHVSALSGYVTTADGERLAFALLTNNDPGSSRRADGPKAMEDAVGELLAVFRRSPGAASEIQRKQYDIVPFGPAKSPIKGDRLFVLSEDEEVDLRYPKRPEDSELPIEELSAQRLPLAFGMDRQMVDEAAPPVRPAQHGTDEAIPFPKAEAGGRIAREQLPERRQRVARPAQSEAWRLLPERLRGREVDVAQRPDHGWQGRWGVHAARLSPPARRMSAPRRR